MDSALLDASNLFPPVDQYAAYAGIGARETPKDVCDLMTLLGWILAQRGYTLRSGGAVGADMAFEAGSEICGGSREIYIPWKGFNDCPHILPRGYVVADCLRNWTESSTIASRHHPAWKNCSGGARKLLTRNNYQILGRDLRTPVVGVICWTRDGKFTGGTGQALRVAASYDIPIYNLHDRKVRAALELLT